MKNIGLDTLSLPDWFSEILDLDAESKKERLTYSNGVVRFQDSISNAQQQTQEAFGFKWSQRDSFESEEMVTRTRRWLIERYAEPTPYVNSFASKPIVLDAGCGAGLSALEYWKDNFSNIHYLGIDISTAVDVCRQRFESRQVRDAAFMQANIEKLPLKPSTVDMIFSEGVMHHTDSTRNTFLSLAKLLKKKGMFLFYVYNKKGPIREFVDDYIREQLQPMNPEEGWDALRPLTKLGKLLGDLDITIDIPEEIKLLDIPAGKINLQRFFYWHVFKAYYDSKLNLEEMNHINYDWYAPKNAHRHTPEEVRGWCDEASMRIVREIVEPSGITIVAIKD
ncbi:class I SAM-dependent methyltransferase [Legionella erythra]|uniref:class I SAM-dependent methyltransferase n=1 Tax=Legionella erythra TaxID=448 RepID=UPI001ED98739|nr:class I SAM-dependent methyltransferase [Legionella erythra]